MEQYYWFEKTGQTPVQMGLCTIEDLDPRWFDAMRFIDAEVARRQRAQLQAQRRR